MIAKQLKCQKGLAIAWVSVVLMAGGLFIGGVLSLARPMNIEKQEAITYQHMDEIMHAVAIYLQKHGRLPCPADDDSLTASEPFGAERGSGGNGNTYGSCGTDNEKIGIVPFRTLGIPEREARDGWRNFITYREGGPLDTSKVHRVCRYMTPGAASNCLTNPAAYPNDWVCPPATPKNKNENKAYFCCGAIDPDFDVRDSDGNSLVYDAFGGIPGPPWGAGGNPYQGNVGAPAPAGTVSPGDLPPDRLAIVLVSHGANGHGAYTGIGGQIDLQNVSGDEDQNADGNGLFILEPKVLEEVNYFDDIITWRTQNQLITELGEGIAGTLMNCSTPFP